MLVAWCMRRARSRYFSPLRIAILGVFALIALALLLYYPLRRWPEQLPSGTKIQHDFSSRSKSLSQTSRQDAVRQEFIHAWTAYREHAWMSDSLKPLTGLHENSLCGWSASLLDALDTLHIMQLDDELEVAINAVLAIRFDDPQNDCIVNLFETTIRHLGGLIAAYDLSQDSRLLPKLIELGDVLHRSFDTFNGLPCSHCQLMVDSQSPFEPPESIAIAAQGSLSLEFARLSLITGDPKYIASILHLTKIFHSTQNDSTIPGLWPQLVDASSADGFGRTFARNSITFNLGGSSDSTYEYLVKGHLFLGSITGDFASMWRQASVAIQRYLLYNAQVPGASERNVMFSGTVVRYPGDREAVFKPEMEHLSCFAGGMFALAAKIFGNPHDMVIGEALTNGCVWAYNNSPTGLMPERFTFQPCPKSAEIGRCGWSEASWREVRAKAGKCLDDTCEKESSLPQGFVAVSEPRYLLRPEAIESVFYYWRLTGDEEWREAGWTMFEAVRKHTRSLYGHAAVENVMETLKPETNAGRARQIDQMESWWFAETLKYYYLLFSEPDLISLDEYVFNTEAHPFRLTKGFRGF